MAFCVLCAHYIGNYKLYVDWIENQLRVYRFFYIYICIYSFEVFRKPSYIQPGISHATSPSLVLTSSAHRKSVPGLESRRRPELQWTCQRCDAREQQDLGQTGWNWSNCLERWLNFLKGELGFFFLILIHLTMKGAKDLVTLHALGYLSVLLSS